MTSYPEEAVDTPPMTLSVNIRHCVPTDETPSVFEKSSIKKLEFASMMIPTFLRFRFDSSMLAIQKEHKIVRAINRSLKEFKLTSFFILALPILIS